MTGRTRGRSQAASAGVGEEVPGSPTKMLRQLQHPEDIRWLVTIVTPALLHSIVPIPPLQSSISISIIQQIIVESFYFAFYSMKMHFGCKFTMIKFIIMQPNTMN